MSYYCSVLGCSRRANMVTVAATSIVKYWPVPVHDISLVVLSCGWESEAEDWDLKGWRCLLSSLSHWLLGVL